jgi:hypothetical protein
MKQKALSHLHYTRRYWHVLWSVYRNLEHQQDLQQLIVWADRKRLSGVRRAYEHRLADEEQRLFNLKLCAPHLTRYAKVLWQCKQLLIPPPRYRPGYAKRYQSRFLTTESQKTYSYLK